MKTYSFRLAAFALLALPTALVTHALRAASPNTSLVTIVAPASQDFTQPTAVALAQTADYVCATVTISSREKTYAAQINDIRQTLRLLTESVDKNPALAIHLGALRSGMRRQSASSSVGSASSVSGITSSTSGGTDARADTVVRILCKLNSDPEDVYNAAIVLRAFVDAFKPAGQAELRLVNVALAVDAPERQRERLIQLIHESIGAMKQTFNASSITISGLEGPVLVRQVSESQVELYIDYKLTVTTTD